MSAAWIPFLAFLLLVITTLFTLYPPQEDQAHRKFLYVAVVVVLGLTVFVFSLIAARDESVERADARVREHHLQESMDQAHKDLGTANNELADIRKTVSQPGAPDDLVARVQAIVGQKPSSTLAPTAIRGEAMITVLGGSAATVRTPYVRSTSQIYLTPQDGSTISGTLRPANIKPGVSFDIVSSNGGDEGKVYWLMYP